VVDTSESTVKLWLHVCTAHIVPVSFACVYSREQHDTLTDARTWCRCMCLLRWSSPSLQWRERLIPECR